MQPPSRAAQALRLRRLQLDLPTLAEGGLDPLIDRTVVGELALSVVPHELTFPVYGSSGEKEPLAIGAGNTEIGARRHPALARPNPVADVRSMVAAGPGTRRSSQVRGGQLVVGPSRTWKQAYALKQAYAFAAPAGPQVRCVRLR